MKKTNIIIFLLATLMSACSVDAPKSFTESSDAAPIQPNCYIGTTIPCNILPMNFCVDADKEFIVKVSGGKTEFSVASDNGNVCFPIDKWKSLLAENKDNDITFEVYEKTNNGYLRYAPFTMAVSSDSIDEYVTYRMIEPSYQASGEMSVNQYNLSTGEESIIASDHYTHSQPGYRTQRCVNCHFVQRHNSQNRSFYYRGEKGGMILSYNGTVRKIDTKTGDMPFSTSITSWHPTLPLIAFSMDNFKQSFHSSTTNKIETYNLHGDLVLYDIEKNEITNIIRTENRFESFPEWAPDGKHLYFACTDDDKNKLPFDSVKYDILRIAFDADSRSWGKIDTVYAATKLDSSATIPKISPDGKFLAITRAEYGMQVPTEHSADVCLINLATSELLPLKNVNSPLCDSYHSWSTNSRWLLIASKREDGSYARNYITHIDENGNATKPFRMPRLNPRHDADLLKSYNVPEFAQTPAPFSTTEYMEVVAKHDAEKAKFGSPMTKQVDGKSGASNIHHR